jgi:hypothetical protein
MTRIISIAAALCLAANHASAASDNPMVDLGYASYKGNYNSTSECVT